MHDRFSSRAVRSSAFALLAGLAVAPDLRAQEPVSTIAPSAPTWKASERGLEDLGLLVRDKDAKVLNELWLLGRYHGQYHWADGSNGNDEGYESRRARLGFQARMFGDLTVHAQTISGTDFEPTYNGFTELWAAWRFDEALVLTLGQQKHRFTHDRNISSRYLNTLERSLLTNMFAADYTPAATLSGRKGDWSYYGGIFSNATSREMEESFRELDSGHSMLGFATLDIGDTCFAEHSWLNFSIVQSDAKANATNLNYFQEGYAVALIQVDGPASLVSEATAGFGNDNGDAYGINIQPGLFLTDDLQVVGRYQLAFSDGENGLRAQRRYERPAGLTTGDLYQAGYFGITYHIAGHRMQIVSGVEYSTLGGEDCWTGSVAFRFFWGPHSRGVYPICDTLQGLW